RLTGRLDHEALQAALGDVVARHESLRTVFPDTDGEAHQTVLGVEAAYVPIQQVTVSDEAELRSALRQEMTAGFDLSRELPVRAALFAVGEDEHVLSLVLHHIAGDGWSMGPLAADLGTAYAARAEGEAPGWQPLPVQYADYALWQRQLLGDEDESGSLAHAQLDYWRNNLAALPEELDLPTDRPRPAVASHDGGMIPLDWDAELHQRVVEFARESSSSVFMVVQAALAALLNRLGAGDDIPIGSPIAGRTDEALDDLIGFFTNTLVLRTDVSGQPTFRELVSRVRTTDLDAYAHQDIPFERLVELVNPTRSRSRHPLFQVMLAFQNTSETVLELPGLTIGAEPVDTGVAKFDLVFSLRERAETGGLHGLLEFSGDLFDAITAAGLAHRLETLLRAVVAEPDVPVSRVELLGADERQQVLAGWNDTANPVEHGTLPALFEAQVARTPDAAAVIHDGATLSYAELDARANRLARLLVSRGVRPESVVALAIPRSADLVVAVLAVVKAGAAYLNIDPDYPAERAAYMCADASPMGLLTVGDAGRRVPDSVPHTTLS
ncbi:MAG: condensation domain-containing protein, partial [Streptomyces sp.]